MSVPAPPPVSWPCICSAWVTHKMIERVREEREGEELGRRVREESAKVREESAREREGSA